MLRRPGQSPAEFPFRRTSDAEMSSHSVKAAIAPFRLAIARQALSGSSHLRLTDAAPDSRLTQCSKRGIWLVGGSAMACSSGSGLQGVLARV